MLHDPSHSATIPAQEPIHLSQKETDILRQLGETIARIASDPQNGQKALLWRDLNDLKARRPMVWINEIPWHEMNVNDELTLVCENNWARELETRLRRTIYQWNHMRGDMIVNNYISCPMAIYSTDFGILEDVNVCKTDAENDIVSRHFKIQISEPEDIEKIKMPVVTHYEQATQNSLAAMHALFDGIIPVKLEGQSHIWYTPWDYMIRWWGVEEAMIDLMERPEMVHDCYERMVQAWMTELDQFEQQNLLTLDCDNTRIGSGGYGYVSDLPGKTLDPAHVRPQNMWGCSNAQIFSNVSPSMHWEFAMEHDLKWLSRWGLTYYGCCEPLDGKMNILRRIPNLRKISVSPWCSSERAAREIGGDYVMSRKPNPAVFAGDSFHPEAAKRDLDEFLQHTKDGGNVELIMKDISTVRYKPERLWEWEKIAMRTAEEYAR